LQAGDVLLLDTGALFLQNHRSDRNFALVAEVDNSQPPRFDRVVITCVCAIASIVLFISDVLDLFTATALACAVMLMSGCLSATAARNSVKWDVIVTIAAAFGLSNAIESTGAMHASYARGTVLLHLMEHDVSTLFFL
jgi:di/tricarboxylate transporter